MKTSIKAVTIVPPATENHIQLHAVRTQTLNKVLESEVLIRFADCDPFNHLNNSKYIEYFMNAREDHLMKEQQLNLFEFARERGIGWVVAKHQITFLQPASVTEKVVIQTTILEWTEKGVLVEMSMWNNDKTKLKSLLWAHFIHFDLKAQKVIAHSPEMNELFMPYENPIHGKGTSFDERIKQVKSN